MPEFAYLEKKFMPLAEAKINIMTHSIHYGTAVFEGIRGNWNPEKKQIYLFRLKEHYQRLFHGSHVLKMNLAYSIDDLIKINVDVVRKSGLKEDVYVRPVAYKSSQALGLRLHGLDDDVFMIVIPWGKYLECDMARCGVSSWIRPSDNVIPPRFKINGLYINNSLAKTEAHDNGFDEAIMLTPDGHVSEGSGENIFLVIDGQLITPSVDQSILIGITRDTVIKLAKKELGIDVVERAVDRGELYMAEECFLTGTAAHITPVSEIDHRMVGNGKVGPLTRKLQKLYFDVIKGNNPKYLNWCTPVYKK